MNALIALEGISGVGKTTHSRLLIDWLEEKGVPTIEISEPSDTEFGSNLKKTIVRHEDKKDKELVKLESLLFATDRYIQFINTTKPALEGGKTVISDRSVYSSYAYQQARGLKKGEIEAINQFTPEPDLVLILDTAPEIALKRLESKKKTKFDAIFDEKSILKEARKNYHKIAKENPKHIKIINSGEESIEKTQEKIQNKIKSSLNL